MADTSLESLAAGRARCPILICDAERRVVWLNAAFTELTGFSLADVEGRALDAVLQGPATAPGALDALQAALRGAREEPVEILLYRRDRTTFWAACCAERATEGPHAPERIVVTLRDIADRVQAEAGLSRLQRTLAEIELMADIGSWELDLKTSTASWSAGAFRIQDVDADLTHMPLSDLLDRFPDDARAVVIENMERLVAERTSFSLELPFTTRTGRDRWIHLRCRANANPFTGEVDRLFGVIQDITARRGYESELFEAREQSARADQAKTAFLANISHEIRTPLNGVMGMLQLIGEEKLEPATLTRVRTAYNSARSLLAILNDIIEMAELEAGQYHIRNAVFDPGVAVREAAAVFEAQVEDKGLRLVVEIDPRTPRAMTGDRGRTRQVLTNLISNAVKFTDAGSVEVRLHPDGDQVCFTVIDTGCGIPKDRQAKLFRSFMPGDDAATRRHGGAGLGLAISRNLVERMGGAIHVESEEGHGTRAWFALPREGAADDADSRLVDAAPAR